MRLLGRLPWETEPVLENAADLNMLDVLDCCIGLKGLWGDDSDSQSLDSEHVESSGTLKADATAPEEEPELERTTSCPDKPAGNFVAVHGRILGRPLWERERLEHGPEAFDPPDCDNVCGPESHGEARNLVQVTNGSSPRENDPPVLEYGPCRHPLATALAAVMVLDDVALVECSAGCGHQIYSDRGPVECPCHWSASRVARFSRALQ